MTSVHLDPRQVVCPDERRGYARLLREFCRGAITNDQYEDAFDRHNWKYTAIWGIHAGLIWYLYDDFHEHQLRGAHRLDRQTRRQVARALLFLDTDLPGAAWDTGLNATSLWLFAATALALIVTVLILASGIPAVLAFTAIWTLLVASGAMLDHATRRSAASLRSDFWPFLCGADEVSARSRPRLLLG
jgi:hypothetical protein